MKLWIVSLCMKQWVKNQDKWTLNRERLNPDQKSQRQRQYERKVGRNRRANMRKASNTELQPPLAEEWRPTVPPTGCDHSSFKPVTQLRFGWGMIGQPRRGLFCHFTCLRGLRPVVILKDLLFKRLESSEGLINRNSHKSESLGTTCHGSQEGDTRRRQMWGEEAPDIKEMKSSGDRNQTKAGKGRVGTRPALRG